MQRGDDEIDESTADLARQLDEMHLTDPPADLRARILEEVGRVAVGGGAHRHPDSGWSGLASTSEGARRRNRRRALFATGWAVAAAFVLLFLVLYPHRDPSDSAATMAPHSPVTARFTSDRVTLVVRRQGDLLSLESVVTASWPVRVAITWDAETLALAGISPGLEASSGKAKVSFTVRDASQRPGVTVRRRRTAGVAEVRIYIDDQEALRAAVPLQ